MAHGIFFLTETHTSPVADGVEGTFLSITDPNSTILTIQGVFGGSTTSWDNQNIHKAAKVSDIFLPTVNFGAHRLTLRLSISALACLPGHSLTQP